MEWNKLPVVKDVNEFTALLDKNGDAGITSYVVRYEATSGTRKLAASKYGFSYSYVPYYSGQYWILTITIK